MGAVRLMGTRAQGVPQADGFGDGLAVGAYPNAMDVPQMIGHAVGVGPIHGNNRFVIDPRVFSLVAAPSLRQA